MIIWIFLILLLGILLLLWLRPYVVKGLLLSWKSGRLGPSIDEKEAFDNRVISKNTGQPWAADAHLQERELSDTAIAKLEALKSTAFLVIKDQKIHYEKYWPPFDIRTTSNSFSVAKSIVATLIGIAAKQGLLTLDDPVAEYLSSFREPPKDKIKIRHLLQMSSGLKWVESEGSALSHNAQAYYGDDLQTMIDHLAVRRNPGEVFRYASGNTQILGMVLTKIVGTSLSEFASKNLWSCIGAEDDAYWNLDHQGGMEKAFCCFYATPRDFARIGQLYLNEGRWNGVQLLDPEFIREATSPVLLPDIWLRKANDIYGLHWWLTTHRGLDFFYARGIRGQYIICNRQHNLIIVRMGHKRNPVDHQQGHPPDLFDHIDAALEIIIPSSAIAP
ncbi:MAG: serine hydrolase [Saprospiraceae bacterium]|nr:serine hydrolase [Saprospiraceae bacterium]